MNIRLFAVLVAVMVSLPCRAEPLAGDWVSGDGQRIVLRADGAGGQSLVRGEGEAAVVLARHRPDDLGKGTWRRLFRATAEGRAFMAAQGGSRAALTRDGFLIWHTNAEDADSPLPDRAWRRPDRAWPRFRCENARWAALLQLEADFLAHAWIAGHDGMKEPRRCGLKLVESGRYCTTCAALDPVGTRIYRLLDSNCAAAETPGDMLSGKPFPKLPVDIRFDVRASEFFTGIRELTVSTAEGEDTLHCLVLSW